MADTDSGSIVYCCLEGLYATNLRNKMKAARWSIHL